MIEAVLGAIIGGGSVLLLVFGALWLEGYWKPSDITDWMKRRGRG